MTSNEQYKDMSEYKGIYQILVIFPPTKLGDIFMLKEMNVIQMTKKEIPKLVQLFTNLLWANSPKDWILKSAYFQNTLFVSMLLETGEEYQYQKIRRRFDIDILRNRTYDLFGLAADCIDEMKTEAQK